MLRLKDNLAGETSKTTAIQGWDNLSSISACVNTGFAILSLAKNNIKTW